MYVKQCISISGGLKVGCWIKGDPKSNKYSIFQLDMKALMIQLPNSILLVLE